MATRGLTLRIRRSVGSLRSDWVEIGGLGRLAVVLIVLALGVTVVLGFSITRSARGHLLDARAAMVSAIVNDLPPFPSDDPSRAEYAEFDVAVRVNLLGGETVRVKMWAPDGTIVYSDAKELIGKRFDLPSHASLAFDGGQGTHVSDLTDPAHAFDRGHGELIEFYVPISHDGGEPMFVFEVEQNASGLNLALGQIARSTWVSIAVGLAAIGFVMAVGVAARTREVNRRRRQAEGLLSSSFSAQEEERRRVVSALHDDIGQPMYRLLYGLEGSRAKLDPADPVSIELGHLSDVVRDMDTTLRNELRLLHFELAADAGLATALEELAELTRLETDLDVDLSIDIDFEPTSTCRTEVYRAAREAVTNVRKHADASHIQVSLYGSGNRLVLDVVDDGAVGAISSDPGLGLSTTGQRFAALDGDVELRALPSGGSRFRAWLPRMEEEPT
ncbi:MAG: hypothetical protein M3132_00300 [Actinomycetia bacterium]|nr:hypothetical protein [Actinomycetes bacterium]